MLIHILNTFCWRIYHLLFTRSMFAATRKVTLCTASGSGSGLQTEWRRRTWRRLSSTAFCRSGSGARIATSGANYRVILPSVRIICVAFDAAERKRRRTIRSVFLPNYFLDKVMSEFMHSVLVLRLSWKWIGSPRVKSLIFQILHLIGNFKSCTYSVISNLALNRLMMFTQC